MDHSEQAAALAQEAWEALVAGLAREWERLSAGDLGQIETCLQAVLRGAGGAR